MAATPGEQILLAQLRTLLVGQAPGSFGPGQVYALLSGYIRLRDRVDQLERNLADLTASVATFAGIDAAARLDALEAATADLVAGMTTREQIDDAQRLELDDHERRLGQLENPPPPV